MSIIEQFVQQPATQALGWTLVHFLWQGALVAMLTGVALHFLRHSSPNSRYVACCAGMAVMMAAPVVTFAVLMQVPPGPMDSAAMELFLLDLGSLSLWQQLSPYLPWLSLFWLAGTFLLQGRLVVSWARAHRLKTRGVIPASKEWMHTLNDLRRRLRIRRPVGLLKSNVASVPMVLGWLKPVILLPPYALTGLTADQLKAVLAHELAHIQRHDYVVNLVQALFESLLFYHPATWWLSNRLRAEREYCCDDVAVRMCRDALCYARALSSLDEMRDEHLQIAMATTGGSLMKRIFRIVGVQSDPTFRLGGWIIPLVFALTVTAAVSAMSVTGTLDSESVKAADSNGLAYGNATGDDDLDKMIKKKEKALVEKMQADGKSEKEIKLAVAELRKKAAVMRNEEILVKKMKEVGKSEKEIKLAVAQLYKKYGWPADVTDEELALKQKEEELIKKMSQAGKSKAEIKEALAEMRMKRERKKEMAVSAVHFKQREGDMIKKMKADGKSNAEIKQAVMDLREEYKANRKKKEFQKRVDSMVIQMKKAGKSEEDIKRAVEKMYEIH